MATVAARIDEFGGSGSRRARTIVLFVLVAAVSWGVGFGSAKLGTRTATPEVPMVTVGHTAHVPAGAGSTGTLHLEPQRPHGHGGGQVKVG